MGRAEENHIRRKERLMELFAMEFAKKGLDKVSMRALGKAANIEGATIYYYFTGKDDLIRQCVQVYHIEIQKKLTECTINNIDNPDKMMEELLIYIDGVVGVCRFLLQVMAHPTYYKIMEETNPQVEKYIENVNVAFSKQGVSEDAGLLLNSIINDYILKRSKERFVRQFQMIKKYYCEREE